MKQRNLPFYFLTAGFLYVGYTISNSSASFDTKLLQLAAVTAVSFYIDKRGDTHYTFLDFKEEYL